MATKRLTAEMRCATFDCPDAGFGFSMAKVAAGLALSGLIFVLLGGSVKPAPAGSANCADGLRRSTPACVDTSSQELAAQKKRPRVVIYGRRSYPGPNAVRQCRSWLAREYRVSGPVIVPQMYCWWE
ncbi:MAG TPA: hypothetical protein VE970_15380 [Pseudolabrys sp.]|jgi:hypothetical protein|nr:hypothetical protein [Pseudolabrys sp.]